MSNQFVWENKIDPKPIVLTVALPALNAEKIIWIALKSLSYQENVTFGWELIVWEEYGKSLDIIKSFVGNFPNCQRIVHKNINPSVEGRKSGKFKGKFLLIDKWIGMAKQASATSKIFVLHAADCYSSPQRLYIHNTHFKNKTCLFSTQPKGIFYNIVNGKSILYNGYNTDTKPLKRTHLNMALLTNDMKKIKTIEINKKIDKYILENVRKLNKLSKTHSSHIFSDETVNSINWKYSLDTDGYNNISLSRTVYYDNIRKPFQHNTINLTRHIPGEILLYLNDLKKFKYPKYINIYNKIRIRTAYKCKVIKFVEKIYNDEIINSSEFDSFKKYVKTINYLK
jgi:hypothetical protein